MSAAKTPEHRRLEEDAPRERHWKRWGPYIAERHWGTVREDDSADSDPWRHFPHEHARMRAYRWGEDGLLGLCDRACRLCFAIALWNERDPCGSGACAAPPAAFADMDSHARVGSPKIPRIDNRSRVVNVWRSDPRAPLAPVPGVGGRR